MASSARNPLASLRPISIQDCTGDHKPRPLALIGALSLFHKLGSSAISIASTILLSRFVLPESFGTMGIAMFFVALFRAVCGPGFLEAAIQAKTLSRPQANAIFWINLGCGGLFSLVLVAGARAMASISDIPDLTPVLVAVSLIFFVSNAFAPHRMLLQRTMHVELAASAQILSLGAGLIVGGIMGVQRLEVWALVGAFAATTISEAIALIAAVRWLPGRPCKLAEIRGMIRYGTRSIVGHLSSYLSLNFHVLALGKFANASQIGFYNRAESLFQTPAQQVSFPLVNAAFPAMASRQHDRHSVAQLSIRTNWLASLVLLPFASVMVVFGDWIVTALLGDTWQTAGEAIRWIALGHIPIVLNLSLAKANASVGRPARAVWVSLSTLPILLGGVIHFAPQGAVAVAMFIAAFRWGTFPILTWVNLKGSGFPCPAYLRSIAQLLAYATLAVSSTFLLRLMGDAPSTAGQAAIVSLATGWSAILFVLWSSKCAEGRATLDWVRRALRDYGSRLWRSAFRNQFKPSPQH